MKRFGCTEMYINLANRPMGYTGFNLSGLPLGEDDGYRKVSVNPSLILCGSEDDALVRIGDEMMVRPMYFDMGFTNVPWLAIRRPALIQLLEMDRYFRKEIGWAIRVTDAYRSADVQQKGFCWAVRQVLLHEKEYASISFDGLVGMISSYISRHSTGEGREEIFLDVVRRANNLFSYAGVAWDDDKLSYCVPGNEPLFFAAVNLGCGCGGRIDPHAATSHGSGGPVDIEFINLETGRLVCMGTPVDGQGIFSHLTYFEPRLGTLSSLECGESLPSRRQLYREAVMQRADLQEYLVACGKDPVKAVRNDTYFGKLWADIRGNRRVMNAVLRDHGAWPYAGEHWHWELNNARGGVLARDGFVSGGACYARHAGQTHCAWGNAYSLYQQLLVREGISDTRAVMECSC